MKALDKLFDAYRQELITDRQLLKELNDTTYMEESITDVQQYRLRRKIVNNLLEPTQTATPDELLVEKEIQEELLLFFGWLKEAIGDRDWDLLNSYVVDRKTFRSIGEELGISKQGVFSRFKNIQKKIGDLLELYPGDIDLVREALTPQQSTKEAHSPTHMGYPHEFLQKVNVGGHWGKKKCNGRPVFISDSKCLIPEYLEKAFGCSDVKCTICNGGTKCNRFPKRKKS